MGNIDFVFGRINLDSNDGYKIKAQGMNIFPFYDKNEGIPHNDIALIKLKSAVPLTNETNTIPIETSFIYEPGTRMRVSGRGITVNTTTSTRYLYTMIIEINYPYKCNLVNDDEKLCAAGQDVCPGDSGGPLVYEDGSYHSLVGIVSYGPRANCGSPDGYGVFQRVLPYFNWIKLQIEGNTITNGSNYNIISIFTIFIVIFWI